VIHHTITIGAFTAFYAYLLMLISPMRTLGYMLSAAQRATASGARIFQVLDRAPTIEAPDDAPELPAGRGRVSLEHVSLTFEGAARPALRDIDLEFSAGSTVALVGAMGSGKTALTSLLPRLYEASSGAVRIDGADVREVDLVSLRRAIAVVTDDPFLFSATVHDNIAYGRPEASREEVERVARMARIHDTIAALPQGYDTVVGEGAATFSEGEKQRLTIARAMLRDAPILILDEPTSALDVETEALVMDSIERLAAGRTTFIIAHRLSTVRSCDLILVLRDGVIAEQGGFGELMRLGGVFADYYNTQFRTEEEHRVGVP
jgi:ABC-type multidrug transport system fused ATPase/permease subunit